MALGIGQATGIKNLQKEIKYLWMSFLNFIEQHNAMRATAQLTRELTFLVVSDITRRSTYHTRNRMLLHIL